MTRKDSIRGFGLVEALVGLGLIGVGAMAVLVIGSTAMDADARMKVISKGIEIESAIASNLLKAETFVGHRSEMTSGRSPTGLGIQIGDKVVAQVGTPRRFKADGQECSAEESCAVAVYFDIRCNGSPAICRAAYRVDISQKKGAALVSLGTSQKSSAATFADSEYLLPIPSDFYYRSDMDSCDGSDDLFVTGFNRLSGKMSCIKKPVQVCRNGQIAKTLVVRDGRLTLNCIDLRQAKCPERYVMNSFDPRSLDPEVPGGVVGTCVYYMKSKGAFIKSWPSSPSVSDRFCPVNYLAKPTGSCKKVGRHYPGTCYYSCGTKEAPKTCSYSSYASEGSISSSYSGNTVSCRLSPSSTSGSCGASWSGVTSWSGECLLNVPVTVPAS